MFILVLLSNLLFVPNRVIVKFNESFKDLLSEKTYQVWRGNVLYNVIEPDDLPICNVLKKNGSVKEARTLLVGNLGRKVRNSEMDLIYIIDFWGEVDVNSVVKDLSRDPAVEYAEPDYLYPVAATPNDPLFTDSYYSGQWFAFKIMCPEAWDLSQGSDSLIFGPVDTGVDWQHPDIIGNLWVNPGEDLNHNGIVDWPADSNGVDDDGNGLIDDVFGWDFMSNDWNPSPNNEYEDHGTHVFGITSASTNNALGIASVAWNSKGIAFRSGQNGYVYTSAAANSIVYAADHGANVENFSWGSYSASSTIQDAVNYAFSSGVLMFGAAGNETTGVAIYPARYDHVIGVGATDYNDVKTFFSNYGPGVDLMAPGAMILSTIPGGGYDSWDGTSMASPVAAGVGGLLMSYKSQLTPAEAESILIWSADDIYPVNADSLYGKLGYGRVNAWRALAMVTYANINLDTFSIEDYLGNGDGRPESGETVRLYPVIYNRLHWVNASNISIIFHCTDSLVVVNDSLVNISSLNNGDTVHVSDDYFDFHAEGPTRFVYFTLEIQSSPSNVKEIIGPYRVLVGYPEIVLIDDDKGDTIENWYTRTLDALNVPYEVWKTENSVLNFNEHNRKLLIWFTGNDSLELITQLEMDSIVSFLSNGGNLFISSQYLAEISSLNSFITNYLHASIDSLSLQDILAFKSYSDDSIFDSVFGKIGGLGSENNMYSPDVIVPLAGADSILYYTNVRGTSNYGNAAVGYKGSYSTMYFAFPFEAIDDNTPTRTSKVEMMADILQWFSIDVGIKEDHYGTIVDVERRNSYLMVNTNDITLILPASRNFGDNFKVSVIDPLGRVVDTRSLRGIKAESSIHLRFNYQPGVYFIKIVDSNNSTLKILRILKISHK